MTLDEEKRHAELSELLGLLRTHRCRIEVRLDAVTSFGDVESAVASLRDDIARSAAAKQSPAA